MRLKTPEYMAEPVRKKLISLGVLDVSRIVEREDVFVFFPISDDVSIDGCEVVDGFCTKREFKPKSLRQALDGVLSADELKFVPTSYTLVGDIAVLELDDMLKQHSVAIADNMIDAFPSVNVVCEKTGMVDGVFRVPSLKILAGPNRLETVHRENNCRFKVDVGKVYFNPRTGSERARVASLVKAGERVLVLFAGVGPYAIQCAKISDTIVYGCELNPIACEYMRFNARKNHVEVDVLECDARNLPPDIGQFDRIIMPLPKIAGEFLDVAANHLKQNGVIHFYCFAHDELEVKANLEQKLGFKPKIIYLRVCGTYSPCLSKYAVDFSL